MMKLIAIAITLAASSALAEPPKAKQQADAQKKDIEIAVEKLERDPKKQRAVDPQDADGDGYGDPVKRAGDPIPDIDLTMNQSPGLPPPPPPPPPAVGQGGDPGSPKAQPKKDRAAELRAEAKARKEKADACKADPKNC